MLTAARSGLEGVTELFDEESYCDDLWCYSMSSAVLDL